MKLFVGNGRLLCKPEDVIEETKGGILLTHTAMETMKSDRAEILQIGPDVNDFAGDSEEFKVGDMVYFGKYAGAEIEVEGITYLIIAADEVLLHTTGE